MRCWPWRLRLSCFRTEARLLACMCVVTTAVGANTLHYLDACSALQLLLDVGMVSSSGCVCTHAWDFCSTSCSLTCALSWWFASLLHGCCCCCSLGSYITGTYIEEEDVVSTAAKQQVGDTHAPARGLPVGCLRTQGTGRQAASVADIVMLDLSVMVVLLLLLRWC